MTPNFHFERNLQNKGYKRIMGLDEAGRGPLAGPVVVAGVIVKPTLSLKDLPELKDSKQLTPQKREEIFKIVEKHPAIEWETSKVFPRVIDRVNILEATKLAMKRVVNKLEADFLIIDGNFGLNLDIPQKSIIKADEKILSCMVAGIIAKVLRDRIMTRYHKLYPQYGFKKHKGYPTKLHREMIKKHRACEIHRRSFHFS